MRTEETISMGLSPRQVLCAAVVIGAALPLAGCASFNLSSFSNPFSSSSSAPVAAAPPPMIPASIRPDEIVGRWGLASYHREQDRPRTEAAARGQCAQAYVISRSPNGVMMLGHDNPQPQEMLLKGGPEGKNFVGPGTQAGVGDDREIVSFDGRVMILRWIDPEVAGRYGNMILVRCGAEGARTARAAKKPPAAAAPPEQ
jgi:hypothetical protein